MRFVTGALLFSVIAALVTPAHARRPNVIVILTDDQRWDDLFAMPTVSNVLVAGGVSFTNAFVPTALCCPSRASILTGLYAHSHGLRVVGAAPDFVGADRQTIATWLAASRYRTGFFGKYMNGYQWLGPPYRTVWHIPPGWQEWHAFATNPHYYDYALVDASGTTTTYGNAAADYSTDVLRDLAVEFLTASLTSGDPFLLYFAPFAPHNEPSAGFGAVPAPRHVGRFAGIPPLRPPSYMEAHVSDKPSIVRAIPIPDAFHLALLDAQRRTYLESLLAVDDALLAMLGVLDQFHQTRNTVVIFTSDNGYLFGEHRLGSKGLPYEEAHRVPLVIRYPRRLGTVGRTASEIALNLDIAPTIARFAHVHRPRVDGRSLVRVLRGRAPVRWRDGFPLESWRNDGTLDYRGIRTREWKYVEYPATGELELYDLTTDPYELENRSTDPTLIELMATLRRAMLEHHAGE